MNVPESRPPRLTRPSFHDHSRSLPATFSGTASRSATCLVKTCQTTGNSRDSGVLAVHIWADETFLGLELADFFQASIPLHSGFGRCLGQRCHTDRKSTRLNSSHI